MNAETSIRQLTAHFDDTNREHDIRHKQTQENLTTQLNHQESLLTSMQSQLTAFSTSMKSEIERLRDNVQHFKITGGQHNGNNLFMPDPQQTTGAALLKQDQKISRLESGVNEVKKEMKEHLEKSLKQQRQDFESQLEAQKKLYSKLKS